MHGKAQHEPAWHSVVLDYARAITYHVPNFACCPLYNVHAVRLAVAVSPNAKI